MVLPIVMYGTPVLRQKGARIEAVTPTIKRLIADMLETMYAFKGIGLAAHQVGVPIQLTVIDVRGAADRPSSLEIDGQLAEIATLMPLVLINPKITPIGPPVIGPEGCLSFDESHPPGPDPHPGSLRGYQPPRCRGYHSHKRRRPGTRVSVWRPAGPGGAARN